MTASASSRWDIGLEHLDGIPLRRISRAPAAAPAVGSTKLHDVEQVALLEAALPRS